MNQIFVKSEDLKLMNGGYLTYVKDGKELPVSNPEFIKSQKDAEWIITFAKLAKTKDFKGKTVDSLEDLRKEVNLALKSKSVQFFETPELKVMELHSQLEKEAMAFVQHHENVNKVEKMNSFLQDFVVLKDFEEYGLFFEPSITKLNAIYTLNDVKEALTSCVNLI